MYRNGDLVIDSHEVDQTNLTRLTTSGEWVLQYICTVVVSPVLVLYVYRHRAKTETHRRNIIHIKGEKEILGLLRSHCTGVSTGTCTMSGISLLSSHSTPLTPRLIDMENCCMIERESVKSSGFQYKMTGKSMLSQMYPVRVRFLYSYSDVVTFY